MRRLLLPLLVLSLATTATAQRGAPSVKKLKRLPEPQANLLRPDKPIPNARTGGAMPASGAPRPVIMMTGYWPPTNEMLREFSDNVTQNPNGWIGSDWEGRGYDVYAYFPEFPGGLGQGVGDFEVDYQDTSADWWPISDAIDPIAVITFSRGFPGVSWEVEMNQYNRASWINDYTAPLQPTPAPPDSTIASGANRPSTLPVQEIIDNVDLLDVNLDTYIDFSGSGGGFLSEFIAYHGTWYQDIHSDPMDPDWCIAGGHVHVGINVPVARGRRAAKQTLRTVIHYVDSVLDPTCQTIVPYCPTTPNSGSSSGALLSTTGSPSISGNNLTLIVVESVPSQFGLFFYGSGQQSAPFGNGTLCITGPFYRILPPTQADADGFVYETLDMTAGPMGSGAGQVTPGSTWNFQWWMRDPGVGAQYNASSAVAITFCP